MADRVGQRLGNYHLQRLIGKGGFAEVYLGEHLRLHTRAALKVLHTRLASADEIEGFQQEAQTIAKLVHPHIVRVLDFDVEDDTPFLVMDYAANGTLRQKHPKGARLAPETITHYIKQAAEALHYAHEHKLIHRDIKPENLLLGENDAILLSDFGIALIAQSSRYQNTQEVVGTMAYMAPEQLQGHPRPASDQYALAITIYEWLTGDRPFHGSFSEIFSQQMFVAPAPLREKLPTLAPAIEEVVLTALAKDPKERFGSVRAFATAFEQACQDAALHFATTQRVMPSGPVARPTAQITPAAPPSANLPLTIVGPSSHAPVEPGAVAVTSTPPGWMDVAKPPASGPAIIPDKPPAAPIKRLAQPERRLVRPLVIASSIILVLVLIAGVIVALKPSSNNAPNTASNFHQEVVTGTHVTSIQTGTGVDTSTSTEAKGKTDTFHFGDTVYVVFSVTNASAGDYMAIYLNDGSGQTVYLATQQVTTARGYNFHMTVGAPDTYQWSVDYNGAPEASITFRVV